MEHKPLVSIITPTTGKKSLFRLIESIDRQNIPWVHILLWDNKREDEFLYPNSVTFRVRQPNDLVTDKPNCCRYSIVIPDYMVQGQACGSSLRAVGMMAANTPYIVFADSDVWWDSGHLESLVNAVKNKQWAYCVRKIWNHEQEYLGEDRFESIGEDSKLPYKLVDNNTLIVDRSIATFSAPLYRETKDYNDDRLMYAFLKKCAGEPGKTNTATINQVCPKRLEQMFRQYCVTGVANAN